MQQKKTITLTGNCQHDTEGNDIANHYQIRSSLGEFGHYWDEASDNDQEKSFEKVVQIISEDIMEQNYTESTQFNLTDSKSGQVAYHVNHSTCHGLRQSVYQMGYLKVIQNYGSTLFKQAARAMTKEEVAILRLAGFCHRLARTNEKSHGNDPSYGPRCAQVFSFLAKELGFNHDLIEFTASTMNAFRSHNDVAQQDKGHTLEAPPTCFKAHAREKAILFERVLTMGHMADLVRCWGMNHKTRVETDINYRINGMLPVGQSVNWGQKFMSFASNLCKETGNKVAMESVVSYDKEKAVASAKNPIQTLQGLNMSLQGFLSGSNINTSNKKQVCTSTSQPVLPPTPQTSMSPKSKIKPSNHWWSRLKAMMQSLKTKLVQIIQGVVNSISQASHALWSQLNNIRPKLMGAISPNIQCSVKPKKASTHNTTAAQVTSPNTQHKSGRVFNNAQKSRVRGG